MTRKFSYCPSPRGPEFDLRYNTNVCLVPDSSKSPITILTSSYIIYIYIKYIIRVFCPKAGSSLQAQEPGLQFCRRKVFHHKLRNQGCSFTRDWIGAVASRCFPHPTLSLASEQNLKDLKDPRGTSEEVRRVDLANWALWTSLKFTTGVKYQDFLTRSEIRKVYYCT